MKKLLCAVIVMGVMASGCATVKSSAPSAAPAVTAPLESSVFRVSLGMTREEVAAIIGPSVVVGYEIDQQSGATLPVRTDSLFSSEVVTLGNETYQIDEYLFPVDVVPVPSPGKDREPMVFQNNILVAHGDAAWQRLKEKYQAP